MSAWAEWRAGIITDSEYRSIMREEELRDRDYLLGVDEDDEEDCEEWDDEDDE